MRVAYLFFSENRPNLLYRKAKVTGKSLEQLLIARVPIPKIKEEALFGLFPVLESLESGIRIPHKLYIKDSLRERSKKDFRVSRIIDLVEEKKIPMNRITQAQLDRITDFQLHNGICLDTSSLPFASLSNCNLSVYLDGVLDPGNIGAITRSCHFFGVKQIIYCKGRGPTCITPSMSKASCGAIERIAVARLEQSDQLFNAFPDALFIGTSDPDSAKRYGRTLTDLKSIPQLSDRKIILILGDEHKGISKDIISRCDILTTIRGASSSSSYVSSLNVSVVAGIVLQEICARIQI